jgi:hypothetical protein
MSRLDDGIQKFGVFGTFAMLFYVLVCLPLWELGVFEWKLFHSSARLVKEQVEICVADRNTEMQLLEPHHLMQEMYGSNEAAIVKRLIANEVMEGLEISEAGFNALSSTEKNRLIETWDNRPFVWEENPEMNFTDEVKESFRNIRKIKIKRRSETAKFLTSIVAEEITENDEAKEANQRRVEANKQARKEDAMWNGLEKEKRLEVCMPEIKKRTKELYFFSRVDRYREKFNEDLATIQIEHK